MTTNSDLPKLIGLSFKTEAELFSVVELYFRKWPGAYISRMEFKGEPLDRLIINERFLDSLNDDLFNHRIAVSRFAIAPISLTPENFKVATNQARQKTSEALANYEFSILGRFREAATDLSERGQVRMYRALQQAIRKNDGRLVAREGVDLLANMIVDEPARQTSTNARNFVSLIGMHNVDELFRAHVAREYKRLVRTVCNKNPHSVSELNTAAVRRKVVSLFENEHDSEHVCDNLSQLHFELQRMAPRRIYQPPRTARNLDVA